MGSFVKGWIWIWLFSNTLSLGLSLLWELASRTYRQPTKGYTAGKVIPKADLWTIRHRPIETLRCSKRERLKVGLFQLRIKRHVWHSRWTEYRFSFRHTLKHWEFSVEAWSKLRFYPVFPQFIPTLRSLFVFYHPASTVFPIEIGQL